MQQLLIDNVRVWDGMGTATQAGQAVEVRDGRIAWVGPASDWPGRHAAVPVVDGLARTLMPGLIDCHVHYSSPGGPEWIQRFTDPTAEITLRAIDLAGASLRSGITSAARGRRAGRPQHQAGARGQLGGIPFAPYTRGRHLDRPPRHLRVVRPAVRQLRRAA